MCTKVVLLKYQFPTGSGELLPPQFKMADIIVECFVPEKINL